MLCERYIKGSCSIKCMGDNVKIKNVTYIKGVLLVNKKIPLPKEFNPGLNKRMMKMYYKMEEKAKCEGINLRIVSGFRSYTYQEKIYNEYVEKVGVKKADTFSARPGHSEHQSGLALDICEDTDNFIDTKEAKWLDKNAHKWGFIIRYPKGKEAITGYKYEPWHIRFVGRYHARKIWNRHITLEEYLNKSGY